MALRGVRGAITVKGNRPAEIISATKKLLKKIVTVNGLKTENIASVIFSTTPDLNAEFPALAARQLGWLYTPLLCTHEMKVAGSLKKCIRVLIHVNTLKSQRKIKNIYLKGARLLRPDLADSRKDIYYQS